MPPWPTGGDVPNWRDSNSNGVVDAADDLRNTYRAARSSSARARQRTTTTFPARARHARADRSATGTTTCRCHTASRIARHVRRLHERHQHRECRHVTPGRRPTCRNGDPTCVPLNLFGGFGSITRANGGLLERDRDRAAGLRADDRDRVGQRAGLAQLPWADNRSRSASAPSIAKRRRDRAGRVPEARPSSCLGGAGGNTPADRRRLRRKRVLRRGDRAGRQRRPGHSGLDLELGYRYADYNLIGHQRDLEVRPELAADRQLLFRAMQQRAVRAPNVGELASPQRPGLDNATSDPCSVANAAQLAAKLSCELCIATGMTAGQVGVVQDIAAGQINVFAGTDLQNLPRRKTPTRSRSGWCGRPTSASLNSPCLARLLRHRDRGLIGEFARRKCWTAATCGDCRGVREDPAHRRRH